MTRTPTLENKKDQKDLQVQCIHVYLLVHKSGTVHLSKSGDGLICTLYLNSPVLLECVNVHLHVVA